MQSVTLLMATAMLLMSAALGQKPGTSIGQKPGNCPAVQLGQAGICASDCNSDGECPGTEKCCSNGCGKLCTKAVTSKPGDCPPIDEENILCIGQVDPCLTDIDCEGQEKCCYTGCSPLCMKPAPRDGVCPYTEPDPEIVCDWYDECTEDVECQWPKKCCAGLCGNICVTPEIPKPGLCPVVQSGGLGTCVEACHTDNDCEETHKCCSNGCGHTCSLPDTNTCEQDGKYYRVGDNVPDPDGCNTCTCGSGGTIGCTEIGCTCEISGVQYNAGEWYPSYGIGDECNQCKCRGDNDHLGNQCTDYYCGGGDPNPGTDKPITRGGTAKPGECPPIADDPICKKQQVNPCQNDQDCSGSAKCCWNGCSPLCLEPNNPKPGQCPPIEDDPICVDQNNPCQNDQDCSGSAKCCWNGCSPLCLEPSGITSIAKPGQCPPIEDDPICVNQLNPCQNDQNCDGSAKCCWNGCSPLCLEPSGSTSIAKPGQCPPIEDNPICVKQLNPCQNDQDCDGSAKCCWNGCSPLCLEPTDESKPKQGQCPPIEDNPICVKQLNPCQNDQDCGGYTKCCWNGCSPLCLEPYNEQGKPKGMSSPMVAAVSVGAVFVGIVVIIAVMSLIFVLMRNNGGQNDTKRSPAANAKEAEALPTKI